MKENKNQPHFATIYDVAKKAGVSIATVSRVLNNKTNVVEKTRQLVLQAIEDLGFKPNVAARDLGSRQTGILQIFIHVAGFPVDFQSSWFPGMINGAGTVFQKKGYGVMINSLSGTPDPEEIYKRLFNSNVDGTLLIAPNLEPGLVAKIVDQRVPIVLVEYRMKNPKVSFVDIDDQTGVMEIVNHFAALGHRKIACLAGPVDTNHNAKNRLQGFRTAMRNHDLPVPENYVIPSIFYTQELGAEGMRKLLALPDRPTAVVAANDLMALGAWDAAVEAGLQVGKDISLSGVDDIPAVSIPPYSLTTIRQDFHNIATTAAEILVAKVENPSGPAQQILVPTPLVIRQSSAPPA